MYELYIPCNLFLNIVGCVPQSMCGSALVIVGMEDVFFVKNTSPMGPAILYVFVFLKPWFFKTLGRGSGPETDSTYNVVLPPDDLVILFL